MALDTTVAGATAESYVSTADADAYFVKMNNAAWAALTPVGVKEAALRRATQYIDSNYAFVGLKQTRDQALLWPRGWVVLNDYPVAANTIPKQVQDACCELALKASAGDLMADIDPRLTTEETVGPITTRYGEGQRGGGRTAYDIADAILSPLLKGGGHGNIPVIRG